MLNLLQLLMHLLVHLNLFLLHIINDLVELIDFRGKIPAYPAILSRKLHLNYLMFLLLLLYAELLEVQKRNQVLVSGNYIFHFLLHLQN